MTQFLAEFRNSQNLTRARRFDISGLHERGNLSLALGERLERVVLHLGPFARRPLPAIDGAI